MGNSIVVNTQVWVYIFNLIDSNFEIFSTFVWSQDLAAAAAAGHNG